MAVLAWLSASLQRVDSKHFPRRIEDLIGERTKDEVLTGELKPLLDHLDTQLAEQASPKRSARRRDRTYMKPEK